MFYFSLGAKFLFPVFFTQVSVAQSNPRVLSVSFDLAPQQNNLTETPASIAQKLSAAQVTRDNSASALIGSRIVADSIQVRPSGVVYGMAFPGTA